MDTTRISQLLDSVCSFDRTQLTAQSPEALERLSQLRRDVERLGQSLEDPEAKFWLLLRKSALLSPIKIAVDIGLFRLIHAHGRITSRELSEQTGAEEALIVRTLRILTAEGLVAELDVQTYSPLPAGEPFTNAHHQAALAWALLFLPITLDSPAYWASRNYQSSHDSDVEPHVINDTAANDTAMNGTAANGTAINGTIGDDAAAKSTTVNSTTVNGATVNGSATNGTAPAITPKETTQTNAATPAVQYANPFEFHFQRPGYGLFDYTRENPAIQGIFASAMQAARAGERAKSSATSAYPYAEILRQSQAEVAFVDVAGGHGQALKEIRTSVAHTPIKGRWVLQDLQAALDEMKGGIDGVEVMACDIFQGQPLKGAAIYHLRRVLHDWDDRQSRQILRHVVDAMDVEHSRVLIVDVVLPDRDVSMLDALGDHSMMIFGGRERSRHQWEELVAQVGLRLHAVWQGEEREAVIECFKA